VTYFREKVEEMKIIQKLRERPAGVDVVGLALGENVASDASLTVRYNMYIYKDCFLFLYFLN